MPAFVYWLAGHAGRQRQPRRPDGRHDRRLHHAPEPALLPARSAARHPGRDPGLARAVRPDLRVPRDGPRDRRCARRRRDDHGSTTLGRVRFNDVSFHYPTAAVPSQRAHDAVARDRDDESARRSGVGGRGRARGGAPSWPSLDETSAPAMAPNVRAATACGEARRATTTRPPAWPASTCRSSRSSRRSGSSTSTSWPNPASWSRWSVPRARARRRPRTSSRGSTTSIRARSRSTTSMSARSSSPRSARSSGP